MTTTTARRPWLIALALALMTLIITAILVVVLVALPWLNSPRGVARTDLGTNVTEHDLPRAEHLRLLNAHSPVPVPDSAMDVRLRYQRFQDSFFEGSFTLPQGDFDAYLRGLQPTANPTVFVGKEIGPYTGSVTIDAAARRVTVRHVTA